MADDRNHDPAVEAAPAATPAATVAATHTQQLDANALDELSAWQESRAMVDLMPQMTMDTRVSGSKALDDHEHDLGDTRREASQADASPLQPGTVFGQYELIRELGRGGMSSVFLARDTRLGRRVAIKFLAQEDDAWSARFEAEARATARCTHDNIVVIHDVGKALDHSYMVLEYLEGVTLHAWMKQQWRPDSDGDARDRAHAGSAVSPTRAVELMLPVVRALAHAHRMGLVHRDLKPENIMLMTNGAIKVLDFGVAKALDQASSRASRASEPIIVLHDTHHDTPDFKTQVGMLVGTLPYMSPEQWRADDIDERSDIWAVGIMLWELVTGKHPLFPTTIARMRQVEDPAIGMPSLSDKRPDLGELGAVVDRCLAKDKAQRTASAQALASELERLLATRPAAAGERPGAEPAEVDSPFAGLAAFQEADAARFFGRDQDIAGVLVQLRHQQLITVVGPSGAGKSSFLRAGVIPALRRSGRHWDVFIVRPGRQPLAALARVLVQVAGLSSAAGHEASVVVDAPVVDDLEPLITTLREQPGHLGAVLRARARRQGGSVLLFVDQFEELYTLGTALDDRQLFLACLDGVADDVSSPLRVALSLRSDFLDRVAEDRALSSELTRGLSLLPPMGRTQLEQALTRPLEAAGYGFENARMVEHMLDSLASTRSPLPLLQFTVAKLWETRDRERKLVTRASYDQLGGVAGALATHADAVLTGLSAREQQLAHVVFSALVTDERTRAMVSLPELRDLARDGDAVEGVVRRLADARLVLIETDAQHGSTVELSHESLITTWPRLGQWLDEDLEDTQFRARLRAAAKEWHKQDRTEDLLWRGQAAVDSKRWLLRQQRAGLGAGGNNNAGGGNNNAGGNNNSGSDSSGSDDTAPASLPNPDQFSDLGARDIEYLEAVVECSERSQRRRRRRTALAFVFLGVVALALSLLAVRADRAAERAEVLAKESAAQATRADRAAAHAHAEAVQARNATRMATARGLQSDPTTVLALTREMEPGQLPPGWAELTRWARGSGVARVVLSHADNVNGASFSPDGTRIVTACNDHIARVWAADGVDPTGGDEPLVVLTGHRALVGSAQFSPDGTRIVTASLDKTARIWPADGKGPPVVLSGHDDQVYFAAFSPDSARVVTASFDKTVRVWRADGEGPPLVLSGHEDRVYTAAFSPDGRRIVSASADGTARVWDANHTAEPLVLRGHGDRVYAAWFSPDGERIATASGDQAVRLWRADGTGQPQLLRGHTNRVYWVSFSPDGERIATASMDKTVRVWRADGTGEPLVLRGHQGQVVSAWFSPDGERVVSASADSTARVWSADGAGHTRVYRGHEDRVYSASFSRDGAHIVTASADKTARIWSVDGSVASRVLGGHGAQVYAASFSPDGSRVVTASADKLVRVFALPADNNNDGNNNGNNDDNGNGASADANAAAGTGAAASSPVVVLRGHEDRVYSAAFSPDGSRIVTASGDRTARIWPADGVGAAIVLRGHEDRVYSAAFSPDGERIATASVDMSARVWRAVDGSLLHVLRGHDERVTWAAFSPDGTRIATGSWDRTVRIWSNAGQNDPHNGPQNGLQNGLQNGPSLVLTGHEASASVRGGNPFSPDGTRIVTHSDDKTIRVWDALTGEQLVVLRGPDAVVNSAAFSPDGTRIVSAHGDNTARLWTDFQPLSGADDPELWRATNYCMPVALRMAQLDINRAMAVANHAECVRRVAAVRRPEP